MIKINLNRSRVPTGEGDGAMLPMDVAPEGSGRDTFVKLLVISIGTVALMLYEHQNLDQLNQQVAAVNQQVQQVKQQVSQKEAELAQLKDIEPQSQALNEKLKILREFSKLRLEQLQSLDFLQSVIPERVWLRSIKYEDKHYQMLGNSVETVDLTDFVNRLEGSAYFQDVIVVEDRDKKVQNGKIRDFELTANSEVRN